MDSTHIVIPFDFPFAILGRIQRYLIDYFSEQWTIHFHLETRHNSDPDNKLVYAVADGQYTYGPLSLFQFHNDEKYSKT